jgi:hypothetical protein
MRRIQALFYGIANQMPLSGAEDFKKSRSSVKVLDTAPN